MLKPEYSWLHRYRTLIMSLSVVVVFITTYLLILPALTLDRNTAGEQGGISLYSEATSDQTSSETEAQSDGASPDDFAGPEEFAYYFDDHSDLPQYLDTSGTEEAVPYQAGTLSYDGKDYTINIDYDATAEIPRDAFLKVKEIPSESKEYKEYLQNSAEKLGVETESISFARFFDIEIISELQKIEPKTPVKVVITYDDAIELNEVDVLNIVHFAEDGNKSEPEVIDDVTLNKKATEISYKQESFSVTGTVVQSPQADHNYALIIHYEDKYYIVENDCTLSQIEESALTFNGNRVSSVTMVNPICWTYTDIGYSHGNIWHNTDARSYDPATGLPNAYTRRYLNADVNAGYVDLNDTDGNTWGRALQQHDDTQLWHYDYNNHNFENYLGVTQDADGTLRLCGNCDSGNAAEFYFAEPQSVPNVSIMNHTVNHIDISVKGQAGIKVPLAYGRYKLELLDEEGQQTGTFRDDPLEVSRQNEVTIEVENVVDITQDDLRQADISTYTINNGSRQDIDNVYVVTGYSQNAEVSNDTAQIRLEGSFKVTDLPPVSQWQQNSDATCAARLEHPIYYDVSVTKPVRFRLIYTDPETNLKYVIYRDDETPFDVDVDVTLSSSFHFWDPANTCPGCVAIHDRNDWLRGVIPDNGWWNQQTGLDGGPGMDFRLGAPMDDTRHDIVAVEITKYVQGDDGTTIRTLNLAEGTDCLINVYQHNTKLHEKELAVGTDGIGMIYDYDVEAGTYDNPAHALISEDPDSVADEIIDADGNKWSYHHSRVETEFAWRNNGQNNPSRYVSGDYTKEDEEFLGHDEVLGEYYVQGGIPYDYQGEHYDGEHEFNRFLEFYVYNIYVPKTYPVYLLKTDIGDTDKKLANAEFDLYGPFTQAEIDEAGDSFDPKQSDKKLNESSIVTTSDKVKIDDLSEGIYYLVETKAPPGYLINKSPIKITVDSSKPDAEAVSYDQQGSSFAGLEYVSKDEDGNPLEEPYFSLTVTNSAGYILPSAGGIGTLLYTISGLIILVGSLGILLVRKRKTQL